MKADFQTWNSDPQTWTSGPQLWALSISALGLLATQTTAQSVTCIEPPFKYMPAVWGKAKIAVDLAAVQQEIAEINQARKDANPKLTQDDIIDKELLADKFGDKLAGKVEKKKAKILKKKGN